MVSTRGSGHALELHFLGFGGIVDDLEDLVIRDRGEDRASHSNDYLSIAFRVAGGKGGQWLFFLLDLNEFLVGWAGRAYCGSIQLLVLGGRVSLLLLLLLMLVGVLFSFHCWVAWCAGGRPGYLLDS